MPKVKKIVQPNAHTWQGICISFIYVCVDTRTLKTIPKNDFSHSLLILNKIIIWVWPPTKVVLLPSLWWRGNWFYTVNIMRRSILPTCHTCSVWLLGYPFHRVNCVLSIILFLCNLPRCLYQYLLTQRFDWIINMILFYDALTTYLNSLVPEGM